MRRLKIHTILPSSPWLADSKTNTPLGVLYIAAVLREAGHDVTVTTRLGAKLDAPLTWSDAALACDVHMIGFCTPQFNESIDIAADLREKCPGALIVAGGPHPSYEPEETKTAVAQDHHPKHALSQRRIYSGEGTQVFDTVVSMEGELAVIELLKDWEEGKLKPFYYGDKKDVPNLDVIPFPAWDLLPYDHIHNDGAAVMKGKYFPNDQYPDSSAGVLGLIGSRGCPYKCVYCSTPWIGQAPRYRSSHNIITEMSMAMDMGVRQFKFQDDTYTLHRGKLKQLTQDIFDAFGKDSYAVRMHTRVNTMDDEIAKCLLKVNTKVCCFGVESGSQKILDANWKGTRVEQATKALKTCKDHGIKTVVYLVTGLAGETQETVRETQQWIKDNHQYIDMCNLAVGIPYPGARFWTEPERFGIKIMDYNYDHMWIVGFSSRDEILVLPEGLKVDDMMNIKRDMFEFLRSEGYVKQEWDDDNRINKNQILEPAM